MRYFLELVNSPNLWVRLKKWHLSALLLKVQCILQTPLGIKAFILAMTLLVNQNQIFKSNTFPMEK